GIDGEGFDAVKNLKTAYKNEEGDAEDLKKDFEGELEDCVEAPTAILPELTEIVWGGAAFVVLLALMSWKLFPTVKNLMEQRTQRIQDAIDDADRQRSEATEVKARYEAELADAKTEAARIVDEAREQAAAVRADLQARAEADIADMRERASADVEASKRQAVADLQSEVSDIALGAAEAVLGRSLQDPEVQRQLVDDYIARVGSGRD
ncbi:MAG: F0F1 ATP synthase subunit B, partial [bacterium]|nr:F0F1 ATP synthase subunit B [bacterium]